MTEEIRRNCTIVADAPEGGVLDLISPDGEIVHQFHVPQGRHRASHWLDLVEPEYRLQIGKDCVCFQPRMGAVRSQHPLALKSDANPDFVPTSATRLEREMRIELNEMRTVRLSMQKEARQRALDKIDPGEAIPEAKAKAKAKPRAKAEPEADEADVTE